MNFRMGILVDIKWYMVPHSAHMIAKTSILVLPNILGEAEVCVTMMVRASSAD